MRASASQPSVEVYCQRCGVSFPVGTRRCLHCGGPVGREQTRSPGLALPPEEEEIAFDDGLPARSSFSPVTLFWVLLLVAGYLYRACA